MPFQYNFDCCIVGCRQALLNIQPVVPTKLNPNWNLIIRTILPVDYPEAPRFGPDWGIRAIATFLFPTGG